MANQQLLIRLPEPLHQAAAAVEQDERLATEMNEWDVTAGDGLSTNLSER